MYNTGGGRVQCVSGGCGERGRERDCLKGGDETAGDLNIEDEGEGNKNKKVSFISDT